MNARARHITQGVVRVLATTVSATEAALAAAVPLARGKCCLLVLLIPRVVPYALPLEAVAGRSDFVLRRYQEVLRAAGTDAECRVCVCRRIQDVATLLPDESMVVIAG